MDIVLNWIIYQFRQLKQALFPKASLIQWNSSLDMLSFGYYNQKKLGSKRSH